MNVQAVETALQLIAVLESGISSLRSLFTQLTAGQDLNDVELANLKAKSDAAAATIAAWHAAIPVNPTTTVTTVK